LSFFRMRADGSRLNLAKLVILSHLCQRLKLRYKTSPIPVDYNPPQYIGAKFESMNLVRNWRIIEV